MAALANILIALCGAPATCSAQEPPLEDHTVKLRSFVDLAYPQLARRAGIQGVVVVKVTLDDEGNVTATAAISGARPLIEPVLANARQWKFHPNPRKTAVLVYAFLIDQNGACHDEDRTLFRLIRFNYATITSCSALLR